MHSPGRLEVIGRHPLTLADAAHNPHGMQALCLAVAESFTYDRLVAVLAIMGDKDIDAMLSSLAQIVDEVVVTANDSPRCLPAADLAQAASGYWSADAVHQVGNLPEAMEFARTLAGPQGCVVATGSVVTAGMARGWARS